MDEVDSLPSLLRGKSLAFVGEAVELHRSNAGVVLPDVVSVTTESVGGGGLVSIIPVFGGVLFTFPLDSKLVLSPLVRLNGGEGGSIGRALEREVGDGGQRLGRQVRDGLERGGSLRGLSGGVVGGGGLHCVSLCDWYW